METLYDAITEKQERAEPTYASEAQRTLNCRWQRTHIDFRDISSKLLPKKKYAPEGVRFANMRKNEDGMPGINNAHPFGGNRLNLPRCHAFDVLLHKNGVDEKPPLTAIFWNQSHREAKAAWNDTDRFGAQLRILLDYLDMSTSDLAKELGLSASTVNDWMITIADDKERQPANPSEDQMNRMIQILSDREKTLASFYHLPEMPFINSERIQSMKTNRHVFDEEKRCLERRPKFEPTLLEELAVLQNKNSGHRLKARQIEHLYGEDIGNLRVVKTALHQVREKYRDLSPTREQAAQDRVSRRLDKLGFGGSLATQIGAFEKAHPCSRKAQHKKKELTQR